MLTLWLKILKYIGLVNFIDDSIKMLLKLFRFSSLTEKIFAGRVTLLSIHEFVKEIDNIKIENTLNG